VKSLLFCLLLVLVELGQPDVSGAFDNRRGFWVHGYVQWIAGSKLMLTADSGAPVAIDISELDQRSYQALEQGEAVTIAGGREATRECRRPVPAVSRPVDPEG
jgi:hypothetical protein